MGQACATAFARLPFVVVELHPDHGVEFFNNHLKRLYRELVPGVQLTRSLKCSKGATTRSVTFSCELTRGTDKHKWTDLVHKSYLQSYPMRICRRSDCQLNERQVSCRTTEIVQFTTQKPGTFPIRLRLWPRHSPSRPEASPYARDSDETCPRQ
jgi:hypothetical protein